MFYAVHSCDVAGFCYHRRAFTNYNFLGCDKVCHVIERDIENMLPNQSGWRGSYNRLCLIKIHPTEINENYGSGMVRSQISCASNHSVGVCRNPELTSIGDEVVEHFKQRALKSSVHVVFRLIDAE